ncbi:MAG: putative quinol monooxygenase [Actinomycetota bacterium]|nr:putative quinol monooxygenase [Actinomycetota bacterium]
MLIVNVFINVKPEAIDSFKKETAENVAGSVKEPGVIRFDLIQQTDDTTKFLLVEVYRSEKDALAHKETPHYIKWKNNVEEMMQEPRRSIKYKGVFTKDKE